MAEKWVQEEKDLISERKVKIRISRMIGEMTRVKLSLPFPAMCSLDVLLVGRVWTLTRVSFPKLSERQPIGFW